MFNFGNQKKKTTLPSGNQIIVHNAGKIYYAKSDPGMMLKYSTYLDIDNAELLQKEVNGIWLLFAKQVKESGLATAIISANSPPADKAFFIGVQQTCNFLFERQPDGLWKQTTPKINNIQDEEYQINFGAIENRNDVSMVFEDSTSIPLLTRDTGFEFGFTIFPPNNDSYNYYCLFFPPKITEISNETGEIIEQTNSDKDGISGFRLPTRRTLGITTMPMWFDPEDIPGKYRIKLYINDVASRSVDFTVYDPQ
ncbi:MAG: hypothetical protein ACFCAD_05900 [Pleurocapsa sp.]